MSIGHEIWHLIFKDKDVTEIRGFQVMERSLQSYYYNILCNPYYIKLSRENAFLTFSHFDILSAILELYHLIIFKYLNK